MRKLMGSASSKYIDFNKIRDELKNDVPKETLDLLTRELPIIGGEGNAIKLDKSNVEHQEWFNEDDTK